MAHLVVLYPQTAGARFDAAYYVAAHLPIVRDAWTDHGLINATVLFPAEDDPAFVAIATLEFADDAAIDAALASPGAARVFGDVASFTDISPVAQRCRMAR